MEPLLEYLESTPYSQGAQALRESLGLAPDDLFLLSLGELNLNKNHQVVLEALSLLKGQPGGLEGIRYGICGEGFSRPMLSQEIRERGLSDTVTLYGYRPDIPQLLACADAPCFPPAGRGWAWRGWNPWPWGCPCWRRTTGAPGSTWSTGRTGWSTPGTTRRALPGALPCCGGWTDPPPGHEPAVRGLGGTL